MEDERIKILKFSRDKFIKEGFYKVTMDQIASELRVSKKTIYKYFPSKENLVQESVEFIKGYVSASVIKVIESEENAIIKIVGVVTIISNLWINVKDNILVDLEKHYPKVWQEMDEFRTMMMTKNITKLFEQGKREGWVKDYPSEIIRTIFMGGVKAVVNPDFFVDSQLSISKAIEMSFEIMLSGLLTEKGKELFFESKSGIKK